MINLKLLSRYKSLQEGFEWNDIPSFAVITGVNGVGKTQLLEVIKGRSERADSRGGYTEIFREISSKKGAENLIFSENTLNRGLSLKGLIEYASSSSQRLVTLREYEQQISVCKNLIDNYQRQFSQTTDQIERLRIKKEVKNYEQQIRVLNNRKLDVNIYSYDEELKRISRNLNKTIGELTESEIRQFAMDNFESLTSVEELSKFLMNENQRYMKRVTHFAETHQREEEEKLVAQERPYQTINRIFHRYGFDYFEMLNPFPVDGKLNGEILFQGREGEIVDYNSLSSGEQAIVKFVIWSYGQDFRGNRLNTMVLDEPDAHLHPSMCKMMVEIFTEISREKEKGGGGIRIIMTTHSPSTVAFTPEGSLFVLLRDEINRRVIRPTSPEEAVDVLSDGIFTFSKAMSSFTLMSSSSKRNLVFVEGKTDILHYTKAIEVLGYNFDVEFFDMHDATTLSNFIRCTPARLLNKDSLIALFDCDAEGHKGFRGADIDIAGVKQVTSEQCEGKSFCIKVIPPQGLEKYCPVEFLYSKEILEENGVLEKRIFKDFTDLMGFSSDEEADKLFAEYRKDASSLRPYKVKDDMKTLFSEKVQSFSDSELFKGFRPTLDLIASIISR